MSDPLSLRLGRDFPAGSVLFKEGERGEEMYVVQSGLIQVLKRIGNDMRPLATLGRGEFIGEMAILNGKPRSATAVVIENARCIVIDAATLEQMVAHNAEIAVRLVKKLARRLDAADELIQILLHPDPNARVLHGLKRHAELARAEAGLGRANTQRATNFLKPSSTTRQSPHFQKQSQQMASSRRIMKIAALPFWHWEKDWKRAPIFPKPSSWRRRMNAPTSATFKLCFYKGIMKTR